MCRESGWHRFTLASTNSLTDGLSALRSPCRILGPLWFGDLSSGGMVAESGERATEEGKDERKSTVYKYKEQRKQERKKKREDAKREARE